MKLFRILVLLAPLLLTACGLSDQQKADYTAVQRSGVSSAIYDKMMHGDPLSLSDIKALARARVSDGVVLRYLRDQGTVYALNSSDVESLRKAGVSQSVIDYMLQTPQMNGPNYYPGYGPYCRLRPVLGRSLLWPPLYWGWPIGAGVIATIVTGIKREPGAGLFRLTKPPEVCL